MAPDFVPGLQLAREFYATAVRPLLEEGFPGLPYAAALLGPGSEVLGFDSQRSTDHDWGPRLQVFLRDSDASRYAVGCTCWPASGSGSGRKKPFLAGAPKPVTTWARSSSPRGWPAT